MIHYRITLDGVDRSTDGCATRMRWSEPGEPIVLDGEGGEVTIIGGDITV